MHVSTKNMQVERNLCSDYFPSLFCLLSAEISSSAVHPVPTGKNGLRWGLLAELRSCHLHTGPDAAPLCCFHSFDLQASQCLADGNAACTWFHLFYHVLNSEFWIHINWFFLREYDSEYLHWKHESVGATKAKPKWQNMFPFKAASDLVSCLCHRVLSSSTLLLLMFAL